MPQLVGDELAPFVKKIPEISRFIDNLKVDGPGVTTRRTADSMVVTIAPPTKVADQGTLAGLFPVRLTQTGGDDGDAATQCSFTYTVKDITNTTTLATDVAMTGNGQRVVNATMTAGTYGMAYWEAGTLKLLWADERISQTNCS